MKQKHTAIPSTASRLARLLPVLGASLAMLKGACADAQPKPNFVFILMDDMGWADISCQGGATPTPNIDALAREGARLTDFYAASNVCSPSRASLLTGTYPTTHRVTGVLFPNRGRKGTGLLHEHATIPEVLAKQGYTSGIVGKWHLGSNPGYMPADYGFSYYYGLPYSNDMVPGTPGNYPDLPLYENKKVVELNPDQSLLTRNYTLKARAFIEQNKNRPFFLYLAHSMPHIPIAASDAFKGKSPNGLYGDVIMEIDWSVGQIVETLKAAGVYDRTIIIITSDNGPWLTYGNHAGSALPLREGKTTTFDGGHRVPFVIKGAGARGVITTPAVMVDILPTFAALAGAKTPPGVEGVSLVPLFAGQKGAAETLAARLIRFERGRTLEAIRIGDFKYHDAHEYVTIKTPGRDGRHGATEKATIGKTLFNLRENPSENTPLTNAPDALRRLQEQFTRASAKPYGKSSSGD